MATPSTSDYHYEHWNTLQDLLGEIAHLRQAYRKAPKAGLAAADRAKRSIEGHLRSADVKRLLDDRLGNRPTTAGALSRARVSDRQIKEEAKLAQSFGYEPAEARGYIDEAFRDGRPPLRIASADELTTHLAKLHEDVKRGLKPTGGWWARRRGVKRTCKDADRRLFCLGVIVADILRPELFRFSYAVGASALPVADG